MKYTYTNFQVKKISDFLQQYMLYKRINSMSADECAKVLADQEILPNNLGPKRGFNFREMLRQGRDGKVDMIAGIFQKRPKSRWIISRASL